jgi:two-component system, chemotaxis family, chemotaxis protein CheY
MEKSDLKHLRVLIVGGRPHAVTTLRTAFGLIGMGHVDAAQESPRALQHLRERSCDAVFCDEEAGEVDGLSFALAARKAPGVLNPMLPIFLVCTAPKRRQVEGARDDGLTDVLVRPISASTIVRKLRIAVQAPRPFILAGNFFGPDRRSTGRTRFFGPDRRKRTPKKLKVTAEVTAALMASTAAPGADPSSSAV